MFQDEEAEAQKLAVERRKSEAIEREARMSALKATESSKDAGPSSPVVRPNCLVTLPRSCCVVKCSNTYSSCVPVPHPRALAWPSI